MKSKRALAALIVLLLVAVTSVSLAQYGRGRGRGRDRDRDDFDRDDRAGVPMWENDEGFKNDVFTFVRIQYDSIGAAGAGGAEDEVAAAGARIIPTATTISPIDFSN